MTYSSHSVEETEAIAAELARTLRGGECIALSGELGAGKTHFVRGLVQGLGGLPRAVSSPTFVLLNVYHTRSFTVFHLDAYRVAGPEDFEGIGFTELLEQNGIVIVEWPERVKELLPPQRIDITITQTGEQDREIAISATQPQNPGES